MHEYVSASLPYDVFSADEIAQASGVDVAAVRNALAAGYVPSFRDYVRTDDALVLVRVLAIGKIAHERAPISLLIDRKRKGGAGLLASGAIHAVAVLALLLVTSMGLLDATDSEVTIK